MWGFVVSLFEAEAVREKKKFGKHWPVWYLFSRICTHKSLPCFEIYISISTFISAGLSKRRGRLRALSLRHMQSKVNHKLFVYKRKFGWKSEMVHCISFLLFIILTFLIKPISQKHYLFDYKRNLSQAKPNYVQFSRSLFSKIFHGLFKI